MRQINDCELTSLWVYAMQRAILMCSIEISRVNRMDRVRPDDILGVKSYVSLIEFDVSKLTREYIKRIS